MNFLSCRAVAEGAHCTGLSEEQNPETRNAERLGSNSKNSLELKS